MGPNLFNRHIVAWRHYSTQVLCLAQLQVTHTVQDMTHGGDASCPARWETADVKSMLSCMACSCSLHAAWLLQQRHGIQEQLETTGHQQMDNGQLLNTGC